MTMSNRISMSCVRKRYAGLNSTIKKESINFRSLRNRLTPTLAENYIMSTPHENANKHYRNILEAFGVVCENGIKSKIEKCKKNIIQEMYYMHPDTLKKVDAYLECSEKIGEEYKKIFLKECNIITECDRVINNHSKLNKRFNIDKLIANNAHKNEITITRELCELIDTYTIPTNVKFNIALENCMYSLSNHFYLNQEKRQNIVESIVDYFLTRENVITDSTYSGIIKILDTNNFLYQKDLKNINYVKENFNSSYYNKLNLLSEKCINEDSKDIIKSIKNIRTEKGASEYISKIVECTKNSYNEDGSILLNSVNFIPLITPVSKKFIEAETKLQECNIANISLLECSMLFNSLCPLKNDIFSDIFESTKENFYGKVLESSDFADSNDVKDIINKFKSDQEKSEGRFRNMITRLYAKNPGSIIDETPKILTLVRNLFIFSLVYFGPVGVIAAAILSLVDKLISMDINYKQSKKLLNCFKEEENRIFNKMKDLDYESDEYKKADNYKKCIGKCIDKISTYNNNIGVEEEDEDDEYELDDDWGFEETCSNILAITESVDHILSLNRQNIITEIENNIDKMIEYDLEGYSMIIANCPSVISLTEYANILKSYKDNTSNYTKATQITVTLDKLSSYKINTSQVNESFIEIEAISILEQVIEESFNMNNVKLVFVNFKKKLKNFDTKVKSFWQTIDINANKMMKSIQASNSSDRREAIIKGSIIPSFSRCIKTVLKIATAGLAGQALGIGGPVVALITAIGMFATNKALTQKEKLLIYDEIATELEVVEKQLNIAENEGDMNQYRFLLRYRKKLAREKSRIKYNMPIKGQNILRAGESEESDGGY